MKSALFMLIATFILLISSCDCAYEYTHEVENQANSTIHIKWTSYEVANSIMIPPEKSMVLFTTIHGIEPCHEGPFFQDVVVDIGAITITKNDSISTRLDFTANEQWMYEDGTYKAVVGEDDF